MRWWVQSAAVLTALYLGTPGASADTVVKLGAAPGEPEAYLSAKGQPTGFYVEVLAEAARRQGVQVQWVLYPRRMDESLANGLVDVWAAANPSPEREKRFHVSRPWWVVDYQLLVRTDSPIRSPADTRGRIVWYSDFPPVGRTAWDTLPGAKLAVRGETADRVTGVCAGQADAALLNSYDMQRILLKRPEGCGSTALRQVPHRSMKMELSIMSLPARGALADSLRSRVDEMSKDGTLSRIAASYPTLVSYESEVMLSAERVAHERRYYFLGFFGMLIAVSTMLVLLLMLRRAHKRTRAALEKARRASRVKSEFMAVMSHEIRTPMHAALGFTDLLLRTPLREEQREHAASIRSSVQCLLGVINDVLDLARLRMGPLPSNREPFSPAQLGCELATMMEVIAGDAGLRFVLRLDPALPARATADQGRLRQILTNLCGNAVKFTEEGEVELTLSREQDKEGAWLRIQVRDTGLGIPESQKKEIFKPFVQVDSSNTRQRGGSGLGLAIVARLCEAMGGTVEVESGLGKGSLFRVRVPIEGPSERTWMEDLELVSGPVSLLGGADPRVDVLEDFLRAAGVPVERVLPGSPAKLRETVLVGGVKALALLPPGAGRLILAATSREIADLPEAARSRLSAMLPWPALGQALRNALAERAALSVTETPAPVNGKPHALGLLVVEDSEVNRKVISHMLAHLGWPVTLAVNGREALDLFEEGRFAAILMDCQMPVMDGWQATAAIRQREKASRTPVIGVTAAAFQDDREQCFAAGMDDFLPKPVSLDQLREMIGKWVRRQEADGATSS